MYYRGDISILKGKKIGVVGTRRPTSYGKIACEKLVRELVENGVTTVSGLASGIDRICHQKTLSHPIGADDTSGRLREKPNTIDHKTPSEIHHSRT